MGSWSTSIFGNDLAADVRAEYRERLKAGDSVDAAVRHVRREFAEPMREAEDRRVVWIALAAAQLQKRTVSDAVREKALEAIAWCEKPGRDPEAYPFGLPELRRLRTRLGGQAPEPVPARKPRAKPAATSGEGGDVLAIKLPSRGEAVVYVAGPAGNDRGPDYRRIVLLPDFKPRQITEKTIHEALSAWRSYYQLWPDGRLGRSLGCYDVKGRLPVRRTRVLLSGVTAPADFMRRNRGVGAIWPAAQFPWVLERDVQEWKTKEWAPDPDGE